MVKFSRNTLPRRELEFSYGHGAVFWDRAGRRTIDLASQTLNLLYGQSHPVITEAVCDLLSRYTFVTQDFLSPDHVAALHALAPLLPPALTSVNLRMNDGSSGVECAVKQARRATGRPRVLTVEGIYLGQNAQVIHFRGLGPRPEDLLIGGKEDVIFAPLPWCRDDHDPGSCPRENGDHFVSLIEEHASSLACVLFDPLMISAGVTTGKDMAGLAARVATACRRHRVPLIFDESQTFGWVPDHTLARHWGIDVDALVLAKGIGGGLPLSVCACKPELDNLSFAEADYTHGGHPAAIAALRATCSLLASPEEEAAFGVRVAILDDVLAAEVEARAGRVRARGIGLVRSVELRLHTDPGDDSALAQRVADECLRRGVYLRTYGPTLAVKPPRVIEPKDLRTGLLTLFEVVDEMASGAEEKRPEVVAKGAR